jgi:tripartite ATP-independent transporter DctP family solute receptor
MKMRHRLLGLVAAAAAVCGMALPAAAADYKSEYRLSIVLAPPTPWGQAAKIWSDLVKERTQGRINIKLYPGVSLIQGDQTREFSALRQGVIDMAVGSTINWSPQVKELNLFSLPFLMPDYAAIDALTQGSVGKKIFARLEQGGVVPLAWGENGYREVTNSKRAMKIRVVGSPIYSDIFSALGANPTQMSWADAQPALSSGAVDGQENPLFLFNVLKMQNVGQKFVTAWGYVADPLIFVVNKDIWNSWTKADQDIVRQAALDAGKQEIAIARKGLTEADKPAFKDIAAMGVNVTFLTPEEREVFIKATRPVYDKWKNTVGAALVKEAEDAIAARKK